MTDNIEIFRDKLGKVKERFRANLVEKIARLRELDAALERTAHSERFNLDAARELRQIAHNLAGTPVGIADPQMNHRSSLLENLLNSVLNAPDIQRNEGYLAEIHELVASIERFANAPVAPDYEFSPPVRVRNSRGLFLVDDDREFAENVAEICCPREAPARTRFSAAQPRLMNRWWSAGSTAGVRRVKSGRMSIRPPRMRKRQGCVLWELAASVAWPINSITSGTKPRCSRIPKRWKPPSQRKVPAPPRS